MRYLLDDHIELSTKAKGIIDSDTSLFICDGVCAEIVYVLSKVYNVERETIKETFSELLDKNNINVSNKEIINKSLELFTELNIDYIDSLLCAYNHLKNIKIETFDNRLKRNLK